MESGDKLGRRRGGADRLLFFVAFAAGTASIIGLKAWGYEQWLVTSIPVLVLIAYALLIWAVPYFRLREDRAGDSCYYLGFLFTLISLGYALFQFSLEAENSETLVTNFGIALVTTITGLMLRVLFAQFREDPVEIEREARAELSEAVSRFRAELDNSVLELNSFRRATQQSFADSVSEFFEGHRELLEKHAAAFDETFSSSVRNISENSAEFAEQAKAINSSVRSLAGRVGKLVERVDGVDVPADLVAQKVAPFGAALDRLSVVLQNRATAEERQQQRHEGVLTRLGETTERLLSQSDALERGASAIDRLGQASTGAVAALGELTERSKVVTAMLSREVEQMEPALRAQDEVRRNYVEAVRRAGEETVAVAREHNEQLRRELSMERELVHRVETGLVQLVETLTDRIEAGQDPAPRRSSA